MHAELFGEFAGFEIAMPVGVRGSPRHEGDTIFQVDLGILGEQGLARDQLQPDEIFVIYFQRWSSFPPRRTTRLPGYPFR